MTITITGLPLQGTILDNTLIPVETTGVTGHITAQSIKTYLSSGTLTSITAGSASISGIVDCDSLYAQHIYATDITTTSDVTVGGNLTISGIGVLSFNNVAITNNVSITNNAIPSSNLSANIGTSTSWFNEMYANAAHFVSATVNSGGIVPGSNVSSALGSTTKWFSNLYANVGNFVTATVNTGGLLPGSNLAANLGSSTLWFNNIYGTASHALYADLAEKYQSDAKYAPGTVVVFGDETEVTISKTANDTRVAGVISTDPAYLMNGALEDGVSVALQGRVPCKVIGVVKRGDLMVTSDAPGIAMVNNNPMIGSVIGKALGNHSGDGVGVIEVVVGRI